MRRERRRAAQLIAQVLQQVLGRRAIEIVLARQRSSAAGGQAQQVVHQAADREAELQRRPARSPFQNGILPARRARATRARDRA
jgi:hypothetical protein